ncbi:PREDICTED: uncharacterized protein LOC101311216 [Fragaria vesca subsp. vesca]|uniref:uncharacterized protein LOC101311216 n=1 Tax=Fragaria vesca subsp. vesca TaxID=101020 RepID=UPI0002C33B8C|nr:PREDICTED: uncharacterized protein LOC101311216 [Fragaria vesca subsp. vesca]
MSAVVCGKRSSIFEEQLPSSTSPPVSSKRIRFSSSSSPVRFTTTSFAASSYSSSPLLDQLTAVFPDMDNQLLEKALEECGDDLDSAIRSLNELRLSSAANKARVASEANAQTQAQGAVAANGESSGNDDLSGQNNLPSQGADWVELFVREMMSASNMDDAKARASRVLEVLEKSICSRASTEAAQSFHQENMMLKEQMEALIQENTILKRTVSTQHERQKECEDRGQELQHLKQLVAQYQEQLRTLEVNNYALTMHLKQAQQSSSIPGRFHPDVF